MGAVATVLEEDGVERSRAAPAVMTEVGLAEGDVLTYLDAHGATAVRRLVRDLEWPAPVIFMAIGALVRERLVRAIRHDLEVILEPRPRQLVRAPVPEVWGG